ncbi:hypothetical protein QBC43DRAFT_125625 [Cladorrhinum sp. PSN259]|nr:hypothetical protein QBC43DRAFT_125625 [Cladorrhinum sp. PSN259]
MRRTRWDPDESSLYGHTCLFAYAAGLFLATRTIIPSTWPEDVNGRSCNQRIPQACGPPFRYGFGSPVNRASNRLLSSFAAFRNASEFGADVSIRLPSSSCYFVLTMVAQLIFGASLVHIQLVSGWF